MKSTATIHFFFESLMKQCKELISESKNLVFGSSVVCYFIENMFQLSNHLFKS